VMTSCCIRQTITKFKKDMAERYVQSCPHSINSSPSCLLVHQRLWGSLPCCSDFDDDFSDRLDEITRKVKKDADGKVDASAVSLLFCAMEGGLPNSNLFPLLLFLAPLPLFIIWLSFLESFRSQLPGRVAGILKSRAARYPRKLPVAPRRVPIADSQVGFFPSEEMFCWGLIFHCFTFQQILLGRSNREHAGYFDGVCLTLALLPYGMHRSHET